MIAAGAPIHGKSKGGVGGCYIVLFSAEWKCANFFPCKKHQFPDLTTRCSDRRQTWCGSVFHQKNMIGDLTFLVFEKKVGGNPFFVT